MTVILLQLQPLAGIHDNQFRYWAAMSVRNSSIPPPFTTNTSAWPEAHVLRRQLIVMEAAGLRFTETFQSQPRSPFRHILRRDVHRVEGGYHRQIRRLSFTAFPIEKYCRAPIRQWPPAVSQQTILYAFSLSFSIT